MDKAKNGEKLFLCSYRIRQTSQLLNTCLLIEELKISRKLLEIIRVEVIINPMPNKTKRKEVERKKEGKRGKSPNKPFLSGAVQSPVWWWPRGGMTGMDAMFGQLCVTKEDKRLISPNLPDCDSSVLLALKTRVFSSSLLP